MRSSPPGPLHDVQNLSASQDELKMCGEVLRKVVQDPKVLMRKH